MSFGTPTFLFIFLPVSILISVFVKDIKAQNWFLVILSLAFLSFGQLAALPVLFVFLLLNYFAAIIIQKAESQRKIILAATLVLNLLPLCFFKYTGFLIENINRLFQINISSPSILLPIGVSFFTFQGISFLIDIYRGDAKLPEDFLSYALYISFFPQFLMGPILEWRDVDSQMTLRSADWADRMEGLRRFCTGLFKNTVIAGGMAKLADPVFNDCLHSTAGLIDLRLAWLGALGYAFELYFDFSGYSDMALGLSRMFGFRFKENFNFPYAAKSIRDFWRRWHISLSTWFRDYVYFPLGGSRNGKSKAVQNRMIVFLLTGIWHGANWTFLVWGLLHGVLSNLESLGILPVDRLEKNRLGRIVNRIYTFVTVVILFAIFRADNLKDGWTMVASLFAGKIQSGADLQIWQILTPFSIFVLTLAILLAGPMIPFLRKQFAARKDSSHAVHILSCVLALVLLFLSICYISQGNFSPSIYMQF